MLVVFKDQIPAVAHYIVQPLCEPSPKQAAVLVECRALVLTQLDPLPDSPKDQQLIDEQLGQRR